MYVYVNHNTVKKVFYIHKNVALLSNKIHYNWNWNSIVLFQSTDRSKLLYSTCEIQPFTHTHTHTFIHWWQRYYSSGGVQFLAQGHFDMQLGGAGIQTSNLQITRRPALLPEPQPLCLYYNGHWMHIVFNYITDLLYRALINNVYMLCFITLWWLLSGLYIHTF